MTAKEMFEELGYKQVKKTLYSIRYEAYEFYIEIWKREELDDFLVRKSMLQKEYVCNLWGAELKAINKQIEELQNKISNLEKDKEKLYDEDYLISKIKIEYTFDSQLYKSIKK